VKNCSNASNWTTAVDSPADAFPSVRPRPVAPDATLRTFAAGGGQATMVRLVVKTNQCTGAPDFQGDQDNDPTNNSDCQSSANATKVRAAELEVVSTTPTITSTSGTSAAVVAAPAARSVAGASAPPAADSRISARGSIRSTKMPALFALTAANGKGTLTYLDRGRSLRVTSARITSVLIDHVKKTATATGRGTVNGRAIGFTVKLADRTKNDAFAIRLSSGYRLGGPLVTGAVRIV
jgi:hypothetical protein